MPACLSGGQLLSKNVRNNLAELPARCSKALNKILVITAQDKLRIHLS